MLPISLTKYLMCLTWFSPSLVTRNQDSYMPYMVSKLQPSLVTNHSYMPYMVSKLKKQLATNQSYIPYIVSKLQPSLVTRNS